MIIASRWHKHGAKRRKGLFSASEDIRRRRVVVHTNFIGKKLCHIRELSDLLIEGKRKRLTESMHIIHGTNGRLERRAFGFNKRPFPSAQHALLWAIFLSF